MDSFEINKIIAAVLLTVLIIIGIGKFTDVLFHVEKPKESAYKIEGLDIRGFQRKLTLSNFVLPFKIISSLCKARGIIKKFNTN